MDYIGIIGAMEEEVKILQESMDVKEVNEKASMTFYVGKLENKNVVIVRSGIGKVNAAVCAQILADDYKVKYVINTGIAGSLKNDINIGDMVLSSDAQQHDVDASIFGYSRGVIPRMKESVFKADESLIKLAEAVCKEVNPDINTFIGKVVSGDQFVSDTDKKKELAEVFHAYCTEMEGAAIAQTAYLNNIPYLIIRAISDKADNSAQVDYKVFEAKAIEHTIKLVTTLLKTV